MAQMNLPMKRKQTHKHNDRACGWQGWGVGLEGEGWTGSLGLADADYCLQDKRTIR